jgi:hypothetical protein
MGKLRIVVGNYRNIMWKTSGISHVLKKLIVKYAFLVFDSEKHVVNPMIVIIWKMTDEIRMMEHDGKFMENPTIVV